MFQYSYSHTGGCWPLNTGSAVCFSTVTVTRVGVGHSIQVLLYVSVQLQSLWWVLARSIRFSCMLQYSYSHFGGCWPLNTGSAVCYSTVTVTLVGVGHSIRFSCMLQYSYSHFGRCWPFNKFQLYATVQLVIFRVPTQTGKPGKMERTFSSQGILIRLEKSGKIP